MDVCFVATLEELRRSSDLAAQPFQGLAPSVNGARLFRVAKRNPGLELATAFSVKLNLR